MFFWHAICFKFRYCRLKLDSSTAQLEELSRLHIRDSHGPQSAANDNDGQDDTEEVVKKLTEKFDNQIRTLTKSYERKVRYGLNYLSVYVIASLTISVPVNEYETPCLRSKMPKRRFQKVKEKQAAFNWIFNKKERPI